MSNVWGKISHVCVKKSLMFACGKGEKQSIRIRSKTQMTAVYTRQDNGPARQGLAAEKQYKTQQALRLTFSLLVKLNMRYIKATKASLPMVFLVCEIAYTAYYPCFHTNSRVLPTLI